MKYFQCTAIKLESLQLFPSKEIIKPNQQEKASIFQLKHYKRTERERKKGKIE